MITERERQHVGAIWFASRQTIKSVRRFHFLCEDGETFSAIAPTEAGAFRVLNAERPSCRAEMIGATHCPLDTKAAQWASNFMTREAWEAAHG